MSKIGKKLHPTISHVERSKSGNNSKFPVDYSNEIPIIIG